jgi:LPXTG-motif cell wall-anchored protein
VSATTPDPSLANNTAGASVTVVAQVPPTTVPPTTVPPTTVPPGALPGTGSNSTLPFVLAAFGLLVVGGLVLLVSRRRGADR